MKELREKILSGLKAGQDVVELADLIVVPDQMFLDALIQLVDRKEIDVIVT